jgi:hypothetical protein
VVGHEMYYFVDGYNSYNQVKMAKEDKDKTTFISKWGAYAYNIYFLGYVMPFQKVITKTFKPYLNKFMQVFLDDFNVYGDKKDHLEQLQKCLEECKLNGISFNPEKCAFYVNLRVLLGHIVYHDDLMVDLRKITTNIVMLVFTNPT